MIKKKNPELIFFNGHGNEAMVTGQNEEVIIEAGKNETLLKNAVTYALSCRSARILGTRAVQAGARAYIGYNEDFVFMFISEKRTRPYEDKLAGLFLDPSNQVVRSLLKGHSIYEACASSKRYFMGNIRKLLNSQTPTKDAAAVRYLLWDMKYLTYHGKPTQKL